MWVAVAAAVIGWVFAAWANFQHASEMKQERTERQEERALYERRIDGFIAQLQANAQGLQFYPQLGPTEVEPERTFVRDDTGLVEYDVTGLEDFAHVAGELD
jgi:hypothetical protein